jgi:putative membrane protein
MPYRHHDMYDGWWPLWLGILLNVLFWGALIVGGVLLVRWAVRSRQQPPVGSPQAGAAGQADPQGLLAERFARGEIDEDEYRSRLGVLREAPPG